jgi:outer membrane protein assembly factor BamB
VPAAVSWRVELPKPTGTGSPVLGPDGTIYIGTFDGTLVAVRPDGQVKWTTAVLRGRAARDPGMMRRSATGAGCSIMMPR